MVWVRSSGEKLVPKHSISCARACGLLVPYFWFLTLDFCTCRSRDDCRLDMESHMISASAEQCLPGSGMESTFPPKHFAANPHRPPSPNGERIRRLGGPELVEGLPSRSWRGGCGLSGAEPPHPATLAPKGASCATAPHWGEGKGGLGLQSPRPNIIMTL
jgi:hypothetical protein